MAAVETAFERGKRRGAWSLRDLQDGGWESAQACLDHVEQEYQEQVVGGPPQHQEYAEGMIAGARESLQALIKQGY